ncbi:GNAT family N-acetyltransferase [Niallia sp. JL1B1071]|uniref:GNAT family N-acetyltransferase n=1 Tax=Niallia tiangongensis TaxID=3237105 RepID=UPI0037DC69EA
MAVGNKENRIEFKRILDDGMMEEVKKLFLEYAHSLNIDLDFQGFDTELNTLPGKYAPPEGIIIVAMVNEKGAGCVALRNIKDGIAEMKRLYVRDEFKGYRIGKGLIEVIIDEAKRLKYEYIRLDTLSTMKKAQSLYESMGFYDIEPYVYIPIKEARFMELDLKSY